jgi:hypothetical protein
MTDASKSKIENLEQPVRELTPEQAEAAEGGVVIQIIGVLVTTEPGPVPPPPPPPPPKK